MTDYDIEYQPLFSVLQTIDVSALADAVTQPWYNRTLIEVGGVAVRLGVLHGEFHWHKHDEQDEFFYLIDGEFRIELEDRERTELEGAGPPIYELPLVVEGIDLAALHRLAAELREQGAA